MQLPQQLHLAIQQKLEHHSGNALTRAVAELSERYRTQQKKGGVFMASEIHRLAYLATRLPATFAANAAVLTQATSHLSSQTTSLLDLGAGPGTASWAATTTLPHIQNVTLVEQDANLIQLGKSLAQENTTLQNAIWIENDLTKLENLPTHDIVTSSYALNELSLNEARQVLTKAWSATRFAFILLEPGTMPGFALVRQLRQDLIDLGAYITAPCPHPHTCPMPSDDWCHFSQRINRSSLHRQLKMGHLGYEDEKFSYVVASKMPTESPNARVLRHPQRRAGNTQLQLCTPEGLQTTTITRSDKTHWKRVRKTNWGDAWP